MSNRLLRTCNFPAWRWVADMTECFNDANYNLKCFFFFITIRTHITFAIFETENIHKRTFCDWVGCRSFILARSDHGRSLLHVESEWVHRDSPINKSPVDDLIPLSQVRSDWARGNRRDGRKVSGHCTGVIEFDAAEGTNVAVIESGEAYDPPRVFVAQRCLQK